MKKCLNDIRFWILLFLVVRLFSITQPPLEVAHNWRQVTGLMVAKNFYFTDANIFFPRVDMAGEKTGITGTEFPLLNYLMYLFSLLFGYADWYGRLINLLVSSAGVYWFYLLVKRFFSPQTAFHASIVLLSSMWFMYSRKTMPDTFSVSLLMGGMYYAVVYLQEKKIYGLLLFLLLTLAGVLSKIPAGFMLPLLFFVVIDRRVILTQRIWIGVASLLILIAAYCWYYLWVPYLVEAYGYWHYYMGTSMSKGVAEITNNMHDVAKKFYFEALKYSGFAVFMGSLIYAIYKKQKTLLIILFVSGVFFKLYMIKAGYAFAHHSYYVIPFVPIMALVAGWGLAQIKIKWLRLFLLIFIAVDGIANQQHDLFTKSSETYKLQLTAIVDSVTTKTDLVAIAGGHSPQELYFTNRKGWTFPIDSLQNKSFIRGIRDKGARVLIINKHSSSQTVDFPVVFDSEKYSVYLIK